MKALYGLFWTLVSTVVLMTCWLAVGTDVLLRVSHVDYGAEYTTITRMTPFGEIIADWSIEARVISRDLECPASGVATYQEDEDNTVTYPTPAGLVPCLTSEPPITVVQTWRAWLFGVIPLRPFQMITIIEQQE